MTDAIIQQIEDFRCARGALFAERRNHGYTLYDAGSGVPVARLRPPPPKAGSKSSIGHSGKSDGPPLARSDAPSCQSMTPYSLSLTRISSGPWP